MFGGKPLVRPGVEDLDLGEQHTKSLVKTRPRPTAPNGSGAEAAASRRVHSLSQLGRHTFADRPAVHREVPVLPAPPTDVSETQKVESLRFPCPTLLPAVGSIAPE